VYISGYPTSNFSVYDPAKPWTANRLLDEIVDATAAAAKGQKAGDGADKAAAGGETPKPPPVERNPRLLGNFYAYTATEYSMFRAPAKNGRIYFGGRRERNVNSRCPVNEKPNAISQPRTLATSGGQPRPLTSSTTTPRCTAAAMQPTAMKRTTRCVVWFIAAPRVSHRSRG